MRSASSRSFSLPVDGKLSQFAATQYGVSPSAQGSAVSLNLGRGDAGKSQGSGQVLDRVVEVEEPPTGSAIRAHFQVHPVADYVDL